MALEYLDVESYIQLISFEYHEHFHDFDYSKVQPNDGLLKEDEDSVRRSLLELEADHARMKKTLEGAVQDAEVNNLSKLCVCVCGGGGGGTGLHDSG